MSINTNINTKGRLDRHHSVKALTVTAILGAVAYVSALVIDVPVSFLSLEIKDAVIVLCGLLVGPIYGMALAVLVPFLELFIGSFTGVYGFIMNTLSSLTFVSTVAWIYRIKRNLTGAIIGLVSGVFAVTAVMLAANLIVTPYYMGVGREVVASMIPKLLLPFNLVKAVLNAAIVLLLYKPLSLMLKKIGVRVSSVEQSSSEGARKGTWRYVWVSVAAVVLILLSLAVIFFVIS